MTKKIMIIDERKMLMEGIKGLITLIFVAAFFMYMEVGEIPYCIYVMCARNVSVTEFVMCDLPIFIMVTGGIITFANMTKNGISWETETTEG